MTRGVHVYFGGTFDPPHRGHHEMLRALLDDPWIDQIHLVPTGRNPLKATEFLGDRERRKAWLKLWLQEFPGEKRIVVETLEIDREDSGPQYTIETLRELQARDSRQAWVLCVGGDIPKDFHRWKDVERLFANLHSVWVFPRGTQADPLADMDPKLRSLTEFRIMGVSVPEISSTQIREASRNNASQGTWDAFLLPSIKENLTDLARS